MKLFRFCALILCLPLLGCQPDEAAKPPAEAAAGAPGSNGATVSAAPLPVEYRQASLASLGHSGEQLEQLCKQAQSDLELGIDALERHPTPVTSDDYLPSLNAVLISAQNMFNAASTLAAVHPDGEVRTAADTCTTALSGLLAGYSLSRPIYDRIKAIDLSAADAATHRFVEKLLLSFRLAGVDRDDATRARVRELNEEITRVGQEFDNNIRDAVNYLELDSVEQLAGLPQDYVEAHPPGEDGKIRISTQYPDLFPFMTYAESDELRRLLSIQSNIRAWPENQEVLTRLLELRFELATLLGFDNYAELVTADKMVGSPQRVESFIDELKGYTEEAQQREYDLLLARLQQDQPDAQRIEPWQTSYLMEKVTREQFDVDSRLVREYFRYNATRDGILQLTQELFGVQIRPWENSEAWHSEVEAWELWDEDQLIGRFYLDMHPRESKYQHAAAFPIQPGVSGQQVPVTALVCNFPRGDDLMQHSQVITFLHEFGHLLHSLFAGHHTWYTITGINTEWDFVEAPSQMLQEWVWDYDTIEPFARNAAGEPLPRELLDKMIAARDFGLGMTTRRQLSLAALSLGLYNRDPDGIDLKAYTDEITRQFSLIAPLEEGHFYANFGHLNGYSAIYYTYQWSLAIASDLFTRFEQEGLRNVETAASYREHVLEPGGAQPAAELVSGFLGREISFKPYADRLSRAGVPAESDP